jgi:hypothetical protein
MKIFLLIVAAIIVAGSFFADYKWRQWMNARRHDRTPGDDSSRR